MNALHVMDSDTSEYIKRWYKGSVFLRYLYTYGWDFFFRFNSSALNNSSNIIANSPFLRSVEGTKTKGEAR